MTAPSAADRLAEWTHEWRHDPWLYVMSAYPWGMKGTALEHEKGPRAWQEEFLKTVGDHLQNPLTVHKPLRIATASGHGVGKSALVSWLVDWCLSTMHGARARVTAYKAEQLQKVTWAELSKWHKLSVTRDLFEMSATALYSADPKEAENWRADAMPWSAENPEGFAGLHNKGLRLMLIKDECSGIDDAVWDTCNGAMTDEKTELLHFVFGNPLRNQGRFRECFGSDASRWKRFQIDGSRTVEGTNKAELAELVAKEGEDSDIVRTRIRGIFPRLAVDQFISGEEVLRAQNVEPEPTIFDPVTLGVDVARGGGDESVIAPRRGRDAQTEKWTYYTGADLMHFAAMVVQRATELNADMTFIDEGGVGGGVLDRCRQLGIKCIGVNNGMAADGGKDSTACANKAAECWVRMREWLRTGGAIPKDKELAAQLENRLYDHNDRQQIVLERKKDMKKRGLGSPDRADALALTFAHPVPPRGRYEDLERAERRTFDPVASARQKFDPVKQARRF